MTTLGILAGFIFWKIVSGKQEGDKIEKSFRFIVRGYYIHIHHWIWCSLLLVILILLKYNNPFVLGFLIGSIAQGLMYKDRFLVFYKKERFNELYSKFK